MKDFRSLWCSCHFWCERTIRTKSNILYIITMIMVSCDFYLYHKITSTTTKASIYASQIPGGPWNPTLRTWKYNRISILFVLHFNMYFFMLYRTQESTKSPFRCTAYVHAKNLKPFFALWRFPSTFHLFSDLLLTSSCHSHHPTFPVLVGCKYPDCQRISTSTARSVENMILFL